MKTKFTIMCILMSFSVISEAKVTYADVIADNAEHKAERIRQYEKKMQDPLATGPLEPGGMSSTNGFGKRVFFTYKRTLKWKAPSDGIVTLSGYSRIRVYNSSNKLYCAGTGYGEIDGCTIAVLKDEQIKTSSSGDSIVNFMFTPLNN